MQSPRSASKNTNTALSLPLIPTFFHSKHSSLKTIKRVERSSHLPNLWAEFSTELSKLMMFFSFEGISTIGVFVSVLKVMLMVRIHFEEVRCAEMLAIPGDCVWGGYVCGEGMWVCVWGGGGDGG